MIAKFNWNWKLLMKDRFIKFTIHDLETMKMSNGI